MSRLYTLKLTKQELWALSQNYAAAFTDPEARSEIEVKVSEKLGDLYQRAHRDSAMSPAHRNTEAT